MDWTPTPEAERLLTKAETPKPAPLPAVKVPRSPLPTQLRSELVKRARRRYVISGKAFLKNEFT